MDVEELLAREGVRDTLAMVSQAGDRLDVAEYASGFAPDGILQFREHVTQGRQAISERMEAGGRARREDPCHFMRHNVSTSRIRLVAADRAEVHSYYHVNSDTGPDHFGDYHDVFEKHGDRWLIKHRVVGLEWVSPLSRHASGQRK